VFSPPKISQQRNDHDILGDLNAEHDLYMKSGKLIDFFSGWEPQGEGGYDLIPARMEQLWIDLYERGYIEIEDVTAAQIWLGTLVQIGYEEFSSIQYCTFSRRFRHGHLLGTKTSRVFSNSGCRWAVLRGAIVRAQSKFNSSYCKFSPRFFPGSD